MATLLVAVAVTVPSVAAALVSLVWLRKNELVKASAPSVHPLPAVKVVALLVDTPTMAKYISPAVALGVVTEGIVVVPVPELTALLEPLAPVKV